MATEVNCPDCGTLRKDASQPCPTCGAGPVKEGELRTREEEVRSEDLEPYVTLRYIARLFKILAILMIVMLIGEVVTGLVTQGAGVDWVQLIAETTRFLVLAGLMWAGGDITLLLIDAGHDLRVARILLGRINNELHRRGGATEPMK